MRYSIGFLALAALALSACASPQAVRPFAPPTPNHLTMTAASGCVAERFGVDLITDMPHAIIVTTAEVVSAAKFNDALLDGSGLKATGEAFSRIPRTGPASFGWMYFSEDIAPSKWNTVITHEWVHFYQVYRSGMGSKSSADRERHAIKHQDLWKTCSLVKT